MTPELPDGWTIRRPTLGDLPAILEVVHASDIAAVGEPDFSAEEVQEVLTSPNFDPRRDSWLAYSPDGRLGAWAYLENPSGGDREVVEVYVHPGFGAPAQAPLLALALERIAARAAESGRPAVTARGGAVPSEEHYIGVLRAAGFSFLKRYARMQRDLTGAERPPDPPPGCVIRPIDRSDAATEEAQLRIFYEIVENAFRDLPDHQPQDFAHYRARLAAKPSVPWDEWLLAEVDGVPAGIVQSWERSGDRNEGWVGYLAVAAPFRGRGVGAALLRTAFAIYAAKGRVSAGLGVDMTNPTGAYQLYHSVGMRAAYEADVYERQVTAAPAV